MESTCAECGSTFKHRNSGARFCSHDCYAASRRRYNYDPRPCETCGAEFTPTARGQQGHDAKFCSRACYGASRRGDRHHAWRGDAVGYGPMHSWLSRHYTHAAACDECGDADRPLQWANVSGEYRREDRDDWRSLCPSCHKLFDGPKAGPDHPRSALTAEQIATIKAEYVPRKVPLRVFADRYGVSVQTIHRAVNLSYTDAS